jgi:predicted dehydrogenase
MSAWHALVLVKLLGECRVHAVADVSPKQRELIGDRFGVPPDLRVATMAELGNLAAARMLAVVAVPTPAAAVAVAQVAAAGHLVLAEKPVAATSLAARAVFDGVGGQVRVVHNYLARSDIRQARALGHGIRLDATGTGDVPVAAFGPDGSLIALLTDADGQARRHPHTHNSDLRRETLAGAPVETVSAHLAGQDGGEAPVRSN